ncbi:MAG TPA: hypothetical protein VKS43_04445 [Burkholderiales bacterium]|nr:hypothetical protein [Burkholderiales bacterium]
MDFFAAFFVAFFLVAIVSILPFPFSWKHCDVKTSQFDLCIESTKKIVKQKNAHERARLGNDAARPSQSSHSRQRESVARRASALRTHAFAPA